MANDNSNNKSIRLDIRVETLDGTTELPADALITYDADTGAYAVTAADGSPLATLGVLRLSDLLEFNVLNNSDCAYVPFLSHAGNGGATNFQVQSFHLALGATRCSTSELHTIDPSTGVGQVGPFALGPTDSLVFVSNGAVDQTMTIALVSGDAVEVEGMLNRGRGSEDAHANTTTTGPVGFTAIKTAAYTALAGDIVLYDTSGGAFTVDLPADPAKNQTVSFKEAVNSAVNALTVDGNGADVEAAAGTFAATMTYSRASGFLDFRFDGTRWRLLNIRA
jgi:hypothetical protein